VQVRRLGSADEVLGEHGRLHSRQVDELQVGCESRKQQQHKLQGA